MKNSIKTLFVVLTAILFTSCYERDIIDDKEFDHSLPAVENLDFTTTGDVVTLSWQIPEDISPDFLRPVETIVQVIENDVYRQIVTVGNENTSVDITMDPTKEYRFVVKLLGFLTADVIELGKTNRVYSEGQVILVQ